VIAPYVAADAAFVALKLASNKEVGDLAPLVMTYPAAKAGIPITLTSIAATEDMRLRVYLLGEHRAVPENYLHVRLNELAIDWTALGTNHDEIVAIAADEAGGHAFHTDFVGDPSAFSSGLFVDNWDNIDLAAAPDAYEFLLLLWSNAFPTDGDMWDVLSAWIVVPQNLGVDQDTFLGDPAGYETELRALQFDAASAAADVEAYVLGPRRDARDMLNDYPVLTHLVSSASPSEMTLDPVFVFNADMAEQDVSSSRTATQRFLCGNGLEPYYSPRQLELDNGTAVALLSQADVADIGLTDLELLGGLTRPAALIIEQTGQYGEPVVEIAGQGGA
jgi:hypothetical protein